MEAEVTCNSLKRVVAVFDQMGVAFHAPFKVIFFESLYYPGTDIPLFGSFDTNTNEIHMLSFRSSQQRGRTAWGLPWNDQLAESFLIHEMAHLVAITSMGSDYKRLAPVWHEFIAYTVQFQLMPEDLRKQILSRAHLQEPYENHWGVNFDIYLMNPDLFAIRSYLSAEEWGSGEFLKKLMDGLVLNTGR